MQSRARIPGAESEALSVRNARARARFATLLVIDLKWESEPALAWQNCLSCRRPETDLGSKTFLNFETCFELRVALFFHVVVLPCGAAGAKVKSEK